MKSKKKKYFSIIIIFLIVLFLVKIVDLSDEPSVRYQGLKCQLNQIYNKKTNNPDLIFFGSSRTLEGINPYVIENEIIKNNKKKINVINLGRSWRGNGQIYQMIKDFYTSDQQIKKAVVIEFSNFAFSNKFSKTKKSYFGRSMYYQGYYPKFYKNATFETVIFDIKSKNHQNILFNLRDFFEIIFYKVKNFLMMKNKTIVFKEKKYEIKKFNKKHCYSDKQFKLTKKREGLLNNYMKWIKNEKHKKNWKQNDYYKNINHINFKRPNFYLNEVINLLKNKNVKVYFLIMPRLNHGVPSEKFIKEIKNKFPTIEIIYGNKLIYEKIYVKKGWRDGTHMIKYSRNLWSKWITNEYLKDIF